MIDSRFRKSRRISRHWTTSIRAVCCPVLLVLATFMDLRAVTTDGSLRMEVITAYNFVVDSNEESPSTNGPSAAHLGVKFYNDGPTALTGVYVNIGKLTNPLSSAGTPGIFETRVNPQGYTGTFALQMPGGPTDAVRYIPRIPGAVVMESIWYDLGNVGAGFDNNGDGIPDRNAWLQPFGNPALFSPLDPSDPRGFRNIPMKGQSSIAIGSGSVGATSTPQLIGWELPDVNDLGFKADPVTATGVDRGMIAGVYADTGIFFSIDPRTALNSYWMPKPPLTGPPLPMKNHSGDAVGKYYGESIKAGSVNGMGKGGRA